MEVFGGDASYDTTSDPIVRVTAAEIRKRIAQYYQEPGHAAELRISLPPGSYVPHFDWPQAATSDKTASESVSLAAGAAQPLTELTDPQLASVKRRLTSRRFAFGIFALLVGLLVGGF